MGVLSFLKKEASKVAKPISSYVNNAGKFYNQTFIRPAQQNYNQFQRHYVQPVQQNIVRPVQNYTNFVNRTNQNFARNLPKPVVATTNFVNPINIAKRVVNTPINQVRGLANVPILGSSETKKLTYEPKNPILKTAYNMQFGSPQSRINERNVKQLSESIIKKRGGNPAMAGYAILPKDLSRFNPWEQSVLKERAGIEQNKMVNMVMGANGPGKTNLAKNLATAVDERAVNRIAQQEGLNLTKKQVSNLVKETNPLKIGELLNNKVVQPSVGAKETGLVSKTKQTTEQVVSPQVAKTPYIQTSVTPSNDLYYNISRLNVTAKNKKAIQSEIDNAADKAKEIVGGTLKNEDVINLANNTSKVLNRTVTQEQTAQKIASNLNLRRKIAASVNDGKVGKDFVDLWMKDKAAGEDIARQLQARSIGADPKEVELINVMLDSIYKVNKNADEIARAAQGVDFNDAKQATEFYRQFVKPKVSEWTDLIRYNSMLTNPNTHIVNISSNAQGTGLIAPIEKTITGIIDATRAALTGGERKYMAVEGIEYAKGYYSNIAKATKRFINVMRGKEMVTQPDLRNIPLVTKGGAAKAEKLLAFPLKALDGMDKFFMTLTEGGAERAIKLRQSKGIKVADASGEASKEATYRLFRETKNKEAGYVLDGIDKVTNSIMALRESSNPVVSQIAKLTFPFIRTPMNLFKQGIEYSPMGVVTLVGNKNKTAQLSKIVIGMASATAAATLLGQNRLTWAEPTDPDERNAFRAAGMSPYSVKIGDHWVNYSKLHPAIAANLATIAAVDDALKSRKINQSTADAVLSGLSKYGTYLSDQSYAKNIGDLLGAVKGGPEKAAQFIGNYPNQIVPFRGLMTWLGRMTDPFERQINTDGSIIDKQIQNFMKDLPWLSEKVPARVGPDGQPIKRQYPVINAFSPNKITKENQQAKEEYDLQKEMKMTKANRSILKKEARAGKETSGLSEKDKSSIQLEKDKYLFEKSGKDRDTINGRIFYKKDGETKYKKLSDIEKEASSYRLDKNISTAKKNNDFKSLGNYYEEKIKSIQDSIDSSDPVADRVSIMKKQEQINGIKNDWAKYQDRGYITKKKSGISKGRKTKTYKVGSIRKSYSAPKLTKGVSTKSVALKGGKSGKGKGVRKPLIRRNIV